MKLLRGKSEKLSFVGVLGVIGCVSGILTDVPSLLREHLTNAPQWMQNPRVQWCVAILAIQGFVMWRIWRKPASATSDASDTSTKFTTFAAMVSPRARRAAMVSSELDGFQNHVLKTPHDQVNQDYVRNMIEVVYPQRIAAGVSEELRDRYVESIKKIPKKKGQHAVSWAVLVFQSAFQTVRDEVWDLVWKEYDANLKPWKPLFLPDATATAATAAVFGILLLATIIQWLSPVLTSVGMGVLLIGCAIGYGSFMLKRQVKLFGALTDVDDPAPTGVKRSARTELAFTFAALLGLLIVAAMYFAADRSGATFPPFPSTIVAEKMVAGLIPITDKATKLQKDLDSGAITKEQFLKGVQRVDDDSKRLLDVVFPALISSYYGDEERSKYLSELQQARQKGGSHDYLNLEVAGNYIQALTLKKAVDEREAFKAHLERLFGEKNSNEP